jgi:required for meiotic nuclear division protein 1
MRRLSRTVASPALRAIHSSAAVSAPAVTPRPCLAPNGSPSRHLHKTAAALLPRRRNFFTSNALLQQEQNAVDIAAADANPVAEGKTSALPKPPSGQPKRKALPGKPARRVTSIAQKPRTRPAAAVLTSTPSTSDAPARVQLDNEEDSSTKISAVCVADGFDMTMVAEILSMHGFSLDPDSTGFDTEDMVHARGYNGADIFVFPTGTVVGWALPADAVATLATRQLLKAAQDPHVARLEEEDLEFELDGQSERSYIKGDRVVLGATGMDLEAGRSDSPERQREFTLAKVAFSAGLARSTKLAVLESSLTSYIESTRHIPLKLSRGSPLNLSRRFVMQKTGELVLLRAQLNHQGELTDTLPDMLWDSRSELGLDTYFAKISRALDVDLRIEVLNDKVTYANEIAGVLREISSQAHSARLEWIIIALIAVEVLIEFRRMYMEHTEEPVSERNAA